MASPSAESRRADSGANLDAGLARGSVQDAPGGHVGGVRRLELTDGAKKQTRCSSCMFQRECIVTDTHTCASPLAVRVCVQLLG